MVTDDELAATLGPRLHAELADLHAPADLAATVARRRGNQNRVLAGALALPVVAGVAVTAVLLSTGGTSAAPKPPPPAAAAPQIHTVSYVLTQAKAALDSVDEDLVQTNITGTDGRGPSQRNESWLDPRTRTERSDQYTPGGQLSTSVLVTHTDTGVTLLAVDYATSTWSSITAADKGLKGLPGSLYTDPADIRAALTAGTLVLVGEEQVGGQPAEHLTVTGLLDSMSMDLWVDATSYLPVQSVVHKGPYTGTASYTWLPRTPANLAKLILAVPAGFTKVGKAGVPTPAPSGGVG